MIDPQNPRVLYAGVLLAGVYKTTDGGEHWEAVNNGINTRGFRSVSIVVINPRNTQRLYYTNGGGVYRTLDGGKTWARITNCPGDGIFGLFFHPVSNTLFVSVPSDRPSTSRGVYRLILLCQFLPCPNLLARTPTVVLCSEQFGCNTVVMSILCEIRIGRTRHSQKADQNDEVVLTDTEADCKLSGTLVGGTSFLDMEVSTQDREFLYALTGRPGSVYRSSDSGNTWDRIQNSCQAIATHPQSGLVAYCGDSLLRITNGGQTWETLSIIMFGQVGVIVVSPHDPDTIYVGGENLYMSKDGGRSWAERSNGLGVACLELKFNPADNTTLYLIEGYCRFARRLERLYLSSDSGSSWNPVIDKGLGLAFDADGTTLYRYFTSPPEIGRSRDNGKTWQWDRLPQTSLRLINVVAHSQRVGTVYAITESAPFAYLSADRGYSWRPSTGLSSRFLSGTLSTMLTMGLFFDHKSQLVYSVADADLARSDNGGMTWTSCSRDGLGYTAISNESRAAVDPRDENRLFLATLRIGVLMSQDGCKTWQSANTRLGNLFLIAIAIDLKNPDRVYAGTDGGACISSDGGKAWVQANQGLLSATVVYSIVVDPKDSRNVYAATPYGIFRLEAK